MTTPDPAAEWSLAARWAVVAREFEQHATNTEKWARHWREKADYAHEQASLAREKGL